MRSFLYRIHDATSKLNPDRMDGFTMLEMVVSLTIATIIGTMVLNTLHSELIRYRHANIVEQRNNVILKSHAILSYLFKLIDSHPLPISPVIHSMGNILSSDGMPNPIMSISSDIRPANDSDAITVIGLDMTRAARIGQYPSTLVGEFTICSLLQNPPSLSKTDRVLGVTIDGYVELTVNSANKSLRRCQSIRVVQRKSMSFVAPSLVDARQIAMIIPISDHLTLYVSKKNELRILSHRGEENIENQPLVDGLQSLRFTLGAPSIGRYYSLNGVVGVKNSHQVREFNFLSRLERSELANIVHHGSN